MKYRIVLHYRQLIFYSEDLYSAEEALASCSRILSTQVPGGPEVNRIDEADDSDTEVGWHAWRML